MLREETGPVMSRHTDYRTLISRARKAGLNTRELYSALAARPDESAEQVLGTSDCNGFVLGHNAAGQRVYRPREGRPLS